MSDPQHELRELAAVVQRRRAAYPAPMRPVVVIGAGCPRCGGQRLCQFRQASGFCVALIIIGIGLSALGILPIVLVMVPAIASNDPAAVNVAAVLSVCQIPSAAVGLLVLLLGSHLRERRARCVLCGWTWRT